MPPTDDNTENASPEENASPPLGLDSTAEELAACEAILEQLVSEQNVWDYLDTIQTRYRVPPQHRQHFYERFIAMVAVRPSAEQDALITAGQPVFRYRVDTARRDVSELRTTQGTAIKFAPTVIGDDFIAEIIHVPGEQASVKYLLYRHADGSTEVVDRVTIGSITYMPPQSPLAGHVQDRTEGRMVLLPTEAAEYGDSYFLARQVQRFVRTWVQLPDAFTSMLVTAYVFLTWVIEPFDAVPYLRGVGDWGAGKTRLISVAGALSQRPIFLAGATTASPIFRLIEAWRGTLVLDEGDFRQHDEVGRLIEKVLLQGYKRGYLIPRTEEVGGSKVVIAFDPFGSKCIATRRAFPEPALDSRCLNITMPALEHVDTPIQLTPEFWNTALRLRNQLQLWRFRTLNSISIDPSEQIAGVMPRVREVGLSLLATIRAVSGERGSRWERDLIQRFQEMSQRARIDRAESWEGVVAEALVRRWRGCRVLTRSIFETVQQDHEEFNGRLTQREVNKILRDSFSIKLRRANGRGWAEPTQEQIVRISATYGVQAHEAVPSAQALSREPSRAVAGESA